MKQYLLRATMTLAFATATACGGSEDGVATTGNGPSGGAPDAGHGGAAGAGGSGGAAGAPGDAGGCSFAPEGSTFAFHLHNATTSEVSLWLGCGKSVPIVLDTPDGKLSAGPGVDVCEFTCEDIFTEGLFPSGCTDCGPGSSNILSPGETFDLAWDRRAYSEEVVDTRCSSRPGTCALAHLIAPASMQTGVLTSCPNPELLGGCQKPIMTSFTTDTTGSDATIEIK